MSNPERPASLFVSRLRNEVEQNFLPLAPSTTWRGIAMAALRSDMLGPDATGGDRVSSWHTLVTLSSLRSGRVGMEHHQSQWVTVEEKGSFNVIRCGLHCTKLVLNEDKVYSTTRPHAVPSITHTSDMFGPPGEDWAITPRRLKADIETWLGYLQTAEPGQDVFHPLNFELQELVTGLFEGHHFVDPASRIVLDGIARSVEC